MYNNTSSQKQAELKKGCAGVKKAIVHDGMKPTPSDGYNSYHKEKNSKGKVKGAVDHSSGH